ncbi:MAG: hypothetical protein AAGD34_00430 [Pseudomonadota bacterium]
MTGRYSKGTAPRDPRVDEAIAVWMDRLQHAANRDALIATFAEEFSERGVAYKDHAACAVVRPRFVSATQLNDLSRSSGLILSAINKVERAIADDQATLLSELGPFGPLEKRLLDLPIKLLRTDVSVRLDATATESGWGFFEVNGAIPGGLEITHDLTQMFQSSDIFKDFAGAVDARGFDLKGAVVGSLLSAFREWGGQTPTPTVALVDFIEGAPLVGEFETFSRWMEAAGCRCILAEPRELEIAGGRLCAKGEPVDVVYRRLTIMEMLEDLDEAQALLTAAEQQLALIIDPFFASVLDRKALFALLTDPRFDFGFTAQEQAAVAQSIPYTRIVEDRETALPHGETGGLLDWCRRERESLVLKPNHDFGGRGISLGWKLTESEWDGALQDALQHGLVVQTAIHPAMEAFPPLDDPLSPVTYEMSTDPFMFSGRLEGILCRLSGSGVSNVTSGGSIVPTFVLHG